MKNRATGDPAHTKIRGDLQRKIEALVLERERSVAAGEPPDGIAALQRKLLFATAELHHAFSFDQVSDGEQRLQYEPRCSTSCKECGTIWVGSKAGEILRLRLASQGLDRDHLLVDAGVRSLVHVHRFEQLIAGLDTGHLMVLNGQSLEVQGSLHIATSRPYDGRPLAYKLCHLHDERACREGTCKERDGNHRECERGACKYRLTSNSFLDGITALFELPVDARAPEVVDLVIATRSPSLLVARLERKALMIRAEHELPAWSRAVALTGKRDDEILVCLTRGGDLLEWRCRALHEDPKARYFRRRSTGLLPTAMARPCGLPGDDGALLIGASDGLYVRRSGDRKPVHVAATRSAVLSIATVRLPAHHIGAPASASDDVHDDVDDGADDEVDEADEVDDRVDDDVSASSYADPKDSVKDYVALGLEDGRLRVIEERALFRWLDGHDALYAHDFPVALGDAVLVLEILEADEPTSRFVLAVMRDHRLRLFHVRSRRAVRRDLRTLWRDVIAEPESMSAMALPAAMDKERQLYVGVGTNRENALRYLLVDEVFPRWAREIATCEIRLVDRACEIAKGADDKVLYRLSATMTSIACGDAGALIQLSLNCLAAMPQRDAQRWRAFVSYHLKRFHAGVRKMKSRDDVSRLRHWARFIRKYLLLGETFADKRYQLKELMERNEATHKYLDALIYATQLAQQRFDLKWSRVACQDEDGHAQDIVRVDLLDEVAVVVTASAEIVFFHLDGKSMSILEGKRELKRLTPERGNGVSGGIRTRAARIVRTSQTGVRIALSWAGDCKLGTDQLRVTIYDVRFTARVVEVDSRRVATHRREGQAAGCDVDVHGITGLTGADAFIVGLDSSESPIGFLSLCPAEGGSTNWVLKPLAMSRAHGEPNGSAPMLPSTPVRAVAAFALAPDLYLAAAGADDGSLRFAAFDREGNLVAIDVEPTLLVHRINDVSLAVRLGDPDYGHVCYVGTETGVSLCLMVKVNLDTGRVVTKQLWRDVHASPVVAVRPTTKPADNAGLLYADDVVFVATQDGHVSIYHAAHGKPHELKPSGELSNYYFQGMRFDRIDLPHGLVSWAIRRSRSGFLAAYPNGVLTFGELYAPRDSNDFDLAKGHVDALYREVMHAQLFFGAAGDEARKLEICAMIRIGGSALRSYILRRQLQEMPLETGQIGPMLADHLRGLSAEVTDERDRIKVVFETVSSKVLDRGPDEILNEYRFGRRDDRMDVYPRVRETCQFLARYLLDSAVHGRRGAVRVRMAVLKALLRVNVFRHAALDMQSAGHITLALSEVLSSCLRDDDTIVRVEALRGVAVALRNISVLFTRADDESHRNALRISFFPLGLRTIQWLLSMVIDSYASYRHHGEPVLLSTAWSYTTVLVAVIRLFPGETLEVCEQLSNRGLGDSLEIIADRLRGETASSLRSRIRGLWTVPELRQPAEARAAFIKAFDEHKSIGSMLSVHKIATDDGDYLRASGLLQVYRRLALLWKVDQVTDIEELSVRWRKLGEWPEPTGCLAGMRNMFNTFLAIAGAPPEDRGPNLRTHIPMGLRACQRLPNSVRLAVERVAAHWHAVLEPKIPTTGETVDSAHRLHGKPIERPNGIIYKIENNTEHVIKVFRYPHDPTTRQEFHRDARLSHELAVHYPASFVHVSPRRPALNYMLMNSFDTDRDSVTSRLAGYKGSQRSKLARIAAEQLTRALRCLHEEELLHGDLRFENVFTSNLPPVLTDETSSAPQPDAGHPEVTPKFQLGDLHVHPQPYSTAALLIPSVLLRRRPLECPPERWVDLLSLTLCLYWVLNGRALDPDADEQSIAGEATSHARRADEENDLVAHAIARMFGSSPCVTAADLENTLASTLSPFKRVPLAGRPLAKFDVFISYDGHHDEPLARALHTAIEERSRLAYLDSLSVVPAAWRAVISYCMSESRAFAILVGKESRPGAQLKEFEEACKQVDEHGLPLMVFQLDDHCPHDFMHRDIIKVNRNVAKMADLIVGSFGIGPEGKP